MARCCKYLSVIGLTVYIGVSLTVGKGDFRYVTKTATNYIKNITEQFDDVKKGINQIKKNTEETEKILKGG